MAERGYDPLYGARPLARVIQQEVRDPLTDEILFGRLEQGGTVTIGVADGTLTFVIEPSPAPPGGEPGTRKNLSNTAGWCSFGMPHPESTT